MGTPITALAAMAHVCAEGLRSEDESPFLILPGSSVSHAVDERLIYYSTT